MVRRYAAGTVAGAAILVSLTGCGGSGSDKASAVNMSAAQAVALVSKTTSTVTSYKVDVTASGTGKAAGNGHAIVGVRLGPKLAAVGTLEQASFGGVTAPAGVRAILLDDTLYAKVPSQFTQFTGGKPWVRFPVSQTAQGTGVDLNGLIKQADPAEQTKIFTGSKDVRTVGTEDVNGEKTTHYQGSLTPKDAATALDPQTQRSYKELYQRSGGHKVVFDLWVGADNLPRKLTAKAGDSTASGTVTLVYSAYNKHLSVSAPPASQVADGAALKSSWGKGTTPGLPG